MDGESDADLVRRCRAGEREAFSLLATRHEAYLRRLLGRVLYSRSEAEDALQEALLQAYLGLDNLRQPERFGAWLYAIALNVARGQMRQRARLPTSEDSLEANVRDMEPQPEQWFQQRETQAGLGRALMELPDAEREAIALVYGHGLSHRETAHLLGVSVSAVKVRVHRGRRRLHDSVFYATITLRAAEQTTEIDCRPSDAINLAVRLDVALHVAGEVMDEAGVTPNEDGHYPITRDPGEQLPVNSLIHEQ